jgi:hypothetical protein
MSDKFEELARHNPAMVAALAADLAARTVRLLGDKGIITSDEAAGLLGAGSYEDSQERGRGRVVEAVRRFLGALAHLGPLSCASSRLHVPCRVVDRHLGGPLWVAHSFGHELLDCRDRANI